MKRITLMLAAIVALSLTACAQTKKQEDKNVKSLVVYFSATGTTERKAKMLAEAVGGDLYEITPQKPYTAADLDWTVASSRSSVEMKDASSHPAIAGKLPDVSGYDVVYVGFPIWWDKAPTIVNTFLDGCDLSGKTVAAFATSGGSSITNSAAELKATYPSWNWAEGRLLNSASKADMQRWADKISK